MILEELRKIGFHAAHRKYKDIDMFNELCAYQDSGYAPEKVVELAKAELEGRLIIEPVFQETIYNGLISRKIAGDIVWLFCVKCNEPATVGFMRCKKCGQSFE